MIRKITLFLAFSLALLSARADLIVQMPDVNYAPGTEFNLPVKLYGASEDGTPIGSAYLIMSFDTAALQFMSFANFNPLMPAGQWFYSGNNNTGLIAANWIEPALGVVALADGSTLFEVRFKAKPGSCALNFNTYEFTDLFVNVIPTTPDHGSYASIQQVTFQVNMRDQVVGSAGVHVAGSFNNWSTVANPMTPGDSTIYSVTIPLISDSNYFYRFVNGNNASGYETVPSACGVLSGGNYNRTMINPGGDTTLPAYCFSSCEPCPQLAIVLFQVDMRDQSVTSAGVHLAGSFNNWSTAATPMTAAGSVYSVSLSLIADSLYTYRFVNGNTAAGYETVPAECGILSGGNYLRTIDVPLAGTVLPDVCFSSCDTCPPQVTVHFRVDMSQQPINPNGVHVAGTFNNWNPNATPMNNLGNNIFGASVLIVPGTEVEFRYVNGNTVSQYEVVPSACGVPAGGGLYNRFLTVPQADTTLSEVCFSNCDECLTLQPVTFRVDMREQTISSNGVHLAGSFNNFNTNSILMTNQGNDVFIATVDILENEMVTYRFVNGNTAAGFEIVPPACGTDDGSGVLNRFFTVPQGDTTLAEVCFSSCDDCELQPFEKEVTFQVDLSQETIAPEGVFIAGTFNGWNPASNSLVAAGNGLFYTTLILNESDIHQYRFVNGNNQSGYETVPEACGYAGTTGELERQLVIPGNDTVLSAVCFSSCEPCVTFQVSLAVDMIFENISVFGVHLAGSFNNWDTDDLQMSSSGSALYQTELTINAGDTIFYRFVNGFTPADMEIVPTACGSLYNGTDYARALIVLSDTTVEAPCFSWCDPCDVGITDLKPAPFSVSLYPVPADDHVTLLLTGPYSGKMAVNIFDLTGKALQSTEFPVDGGLHNYDLVTSSLPRGIYIARYLFQSSGAEFAGSVKIMINR